MPLPIVAIIGLAPMWANLLSSIALRVIRRAIVHDEPGVIAPMSQLSGAIAIF